MSLSQATVKFESHQSILGAGVLFLLPALLSQGSLKTKELYQLPANHYYGLESELLTLTYRKTTTNYRTSVNTSVTTNPMVERGHHQVIRKKRH